MGMDIVFEIVNNDQTIITARQTWWEANNTDKALIELSNVLDIAERFKECDHETLATLMCFGFKSPYFKNHQKLDELAKLGVVTEEQVQHNKFLYRDPSGSIYTYIYFGSVRGIALPRKVIINLSTRTFSFNVYKLIDANERVYHETIKIDNVDRSFGDIEKFVEEHDIWHLDTFRISSEQGYYAKLKLDI